MPQPPDTELTVTLDVQAPAHQTWDALADWDHQGDWIIGTRVRATTHDGRGVGGGIEAWTGIGPFGFLDTMVITEWDPPRRCVVKHTGRVVRGGGVFEVSPITASRCTVLWTEQLELPFGPLGRLGWRLARPAVRWGIVRSLKNLAARLETTARLETATHPESETLPDSLR